MNEAAKFFAEHSTVALFGVVLLEQLGLPLPAMPWLLAAGALAANGTADPIGALAGALLACLVADSAWFYVGRRSGRRALGLLCRMSLEPNCCVRRSEGFLARHAEKGLVAAKFLPGLGMVIPPLAATLGMGYRRFLLFDGIGSLLYALSGIVLGYLFHEELSGMFALLNRFGVGAAALALAVVAGYIAIKVWKKRRSMSRAQGRAGQPALLDSQKTGTADRTRDPRKNEAYSKRREPKDEAGLDQIPGVNLTLASPEVLREA